MVAPAREPATLEDLLARDDADRLEIIGGEIVQKATPSPGHSFGQFNLAVAVGSFNRRQGQDGPGGWWLFTEIHVGYPRGEIAPGQSVPRASWIGALYGIDERAGGDLAAAITAADRGVALMPWEFATATSDSHTS